MILPLRAVVFQILLTTVAIAVESLLLHKRLKLSRKTSLEYAVSLNFLTLFAGWYLFFVFFDTLPSQMKLNVIELILFNKASNQTLLLLFVAGVLTFFISLGIKLKGWQGLEYLRNEVLFAEPLESNVQFIKTSNFFNPASVRVLTILQAHSLSYSTISLLLVFELLLTS
ncbi:MAG: filament integrity protein FraC [Hormoscilla sp.]